MTDKNLTKSTLVFIGFFACGRMQCDAIDIADATHLQMYLAAFDGIVLGKQST